MPIACKRFTVIFTHNGTMIVLLRIDGGLLMIAQCSITEKAILHRQMSTTDCYRFYFYCYNSIFARIVHVRYVIYMYIHVVYTQVNAMSYAVYIHTTQSKRSICWARKRLLRIVNPLRRLLPHRRELLFRRDAGIIGVAARGLPSVIGDESWAATAVSLTQSRHWCWLIAAAAASVNLVTSAAAGYWAGER